MSTAPAHKQKKNEVAEAPFQITKEQVKLADQRACTICPVLHSQNQNKL